MKTKSVVILSHGGNVGLPAGNVTAFLNERGCRVTVLSAVRDADIVQVPLPDVVVLLVSEHSGVPNLHGAAVQTVPLIVVPADATGEQILEAIDVSSWPSNGTSPEERSVIRHPSVHESLLDGHRLIGQSPQVRQVRTHIQNVALTDTNVLITGETGTGKELIAQLIHRNSRRRNRPFICVNCAAIPDSLLESELFGFERGAFTGAHTRYRGKLEMANGGTVFFDEIGEMTPYAQAKLLRVIENRELQRLGGGQIIHLDIRILAATNCELDAAQGSLPFRRDLYYRLNVARMCLPALRDRAEDIPLLIDYYIREFNHRFGRQVTAFIDQDQPHLVRYDWPGNVRELRNVVESAFVALPPSPVFHVEIPSHIRPRIVGVNARPDTEHDRLIYALWSTDGNRSKAARQLNWSRMTLYRKMLKYGLTSRDQAVQSTCLPRERGR
jgi:transcriptional regulator with PAS, ATPase and Fis domain